MQYKVFQNIEIPVIGLWTWWIWGFMEADYSQDAESIRVISAAIDMGYSHIDTAEMYGNWHTEELIGQAIKWKNRSDILITDKVTKTHLRYDDLISSCAKSLERLGTDYIDFYLIHAPNPDIHIEETMRAMDYLVEHSMIRYIGVSNFSVVQLSEAQNFTKNKIITNQIHYNIVTRDADIENYRDTESGILPFCQNHDVCIMAYRPIERGFILREHSLLDALSTKYDKTKSQIALNWLVSKANIVALVKSVNIAHLKENLWALWWSLSEEDMSLLDTIRFENPLVR
jgi:diketogulonate reductase-like aldo/keto reductase